MVHETHSYSFKYLPLHFRPCPSDISPFVPLVFLFTFVLFHSQGGDHVQADSEDASKPSCLVVVRPPRLFDGSVVCDQQVVLSFFLILTAVLFFLLLWESRLWRQNKRPSSMLCVSIIVDSLSMQQKCMVSRLRSPISSWTISCSCNSRFESFLTLSSVRHFL
jgi:hypothetical protein